MQVLFGKNSHMAYITAVSMPSSVEGCAARGHAKKKDGSLNCLITALELHYTALELHCAELMLEKRGSYRAHGEERVDAIALLHDGAQRAQADRPQLHQALPLLWCQPQQPLHANAASTNPPQPHASSQHLLQRGGYNNSQKQGHASAVCQGAAHSIMPSKVQETPMPCKRQVWIQQGLLAGALTVMPAQTWILSSPNSLFEFSSLQAARVLNMPG